MSLSPEHSRTDSVENLQLLLPAVLSQVREDQRLLARISLDALEGIPEKNRENDKDYVYLDQLLEKYYKNANEDPNLLAAYAQVEQVTGFFLELAGKLLVVKNDVSESEKGFLKAIVDRPIDDSLVEEYSKSQSARQGRDLIQRSLVELERINGKKAPALEKALTDLYTEIAVQKKESIVKIRNQKYQPLAQMLADAVRQYPALEEALWSTAEAFMLKLQAAMLFRNLQELEENVNMLLQRPTYHQLKTVLLEKVRKSLDHNLKAGQKAYAPRDNLAQELADALRETNTYMGRNKAKAINELKQKLWAEIENTLFGKEWEAKELLALQRSVQANLQQFLEN